MNFKYNRVYECTISKSPGYKVGKKYTCTKHPMTEVLSLKGDDGFYDDVRMLVSKFKEVKDDS